MYKLTPTYQKHDGIQEVRVLEYQQYLKRLQRAHDLSVPPPGGGGSSQASPEDQQMGFQTNIPHQRAAFVPPLMPYSNTNSYHFPQQVGRPSQQTNIASFPSYVDFSHHPVPEDQQMGFHAKIQHQGASFVPPWTPYANTHMYHFPQQVATAFTVLCDDHVFWPKKFLPCILAPFEDPHLGCVGTRKSAPHYPKLLLCRLLEFPRLSLPRASQLRDSSHRYLSSEIPSTCTPLFFFHHRSQSFNCLYQHSEPLTSRREAAMKLTLIIVGSLALPLCILADTHYHQVTSRLAPHFEDNEVPTKTLTTRTDNDMKNFTFDELFTLQKKFLDNFITPNNTIQAESINSTLLAEDVQGRVDITRTFDRQELNTEYLFGLFANLANSTNSQPQIRYRHYISKPELVQLLGDIPGIDCRTLKRSQLEQMCKDRGLSIATTANPEEVMVGKLEEHDRLNRTGG